MSRQTVTQRSFIHGEPRIGFLERKDLEIRAQSCRGALNMRVTATGGMQSRPGSRYIAEYDDARTGVEIRPASNVTFSLIVRETRLLIVNALGDVIEDYAAPWLPNGIVWIEPFRERTIIGGAFGLYVLTYDNGSWTFDRMAFATAASGELAQPYWAFQQGISIQPSGRTGNITVSASVALWTPGYVGLRVRYGKREIIVTGYTSPTLISGTVAGSLPPSFELTVASNALIQVGDAVIGQDTNFQGLVVSKSAGKIRVVTIEFLDGPDLSEKISFPNGTTTVSAKVEIPPVLSPLWDEPLMSDVRGWPLAGASAAGRLTLVDFPKVADLVVLSSSRDITDLQVGSDADDAISRTVGENSPRFLHVINAGDLLLFSTEGVYVQNLRDSDALTPSNFNVVQVDARGANEVRPVKVDSGVIFVEANGSAIAAALLDGNVYLKWTVRTISTLHNQLIKTPVGLCGPSVFSSLPEKYVFVVNQDGTVAAMSWTVNFDPETIGFVPWSTDGAFKAMWPAFGSYWAVTARQVNRVLVRILEALDDNVVVDCAVTVTPAQMLELNGSNLELNGEMFEVQAEAIPFVGEEVAMVLNGWDLGSYTVNGSGLLDRDIPVGSLIGFNFEARLSPWAVEMIEHPYAGMRRARTTGGSVSVLATGPFKIRANNTTRSINGYAFGNDFSMPPPASTAVHRFMVIGVRDHPEIEIIKDRPGRFSILALTQEVQA